MERQVYYDKKYNRFFGVIKKYPRSYLITSLHGFYGTAKTGDTFRYSIPKSYLKTCVLCENENNEFSELHYSILDKLPMGYVIKGYNPITDIEPEIDKTIFKWNKIQHKIVQYRWDKQNNFWKDMPDYDNWDNDIPDDWPDTYPDETIEAN